MTSEPIEGSITSRLNASIEARSDSGVLRVAKMRALF
jgi:hypothetical protein